MKWSHRHPCCFLLLGSSSLSSSTVSSSTAAPLSSLNLNHHRQFRRHHRAFFVSSSSSTRGAAAATATGTSNLLRNPPLPPGSKTLVITTPSSSSSSSSPGISAVTTATTSSTGTVSTAATALPLLFNMNPNQHQPQQTISSISVEAAAEMDDVAYVAAAAADAGAAMGGGGTSLKLEGSGVQSTMKATSSSSTVHATFQNCNVDDDKNCYLNERKDTFMGGEGIVVVEDQSSPSFLLDGVLRSDDDGHDEQQQQSEMNEEEEDDIMMINGGKGPCRSIEEASVNTTIESLTIAEEEEQDPMSMGGGGECGTLPTASTTTMTTTTTTTASEERLQSQTQARRPSYQHHNVKLRLTPEEENLFNLLTQAAEHYESGLLTLDPAISPTTGELEENDTWGENIKFGGGFTPEQRRLQMQLIQQKQQQQRQLQQQWGEDNDRLEEGDINDEVLRQQQQKSTASSPQRRQFIEIRIAGGWVRDKLLNQHSVDVDVALDCMMGVQFAKIVQRYMMMTTMTTTASSSPSSPSSPAMDVVDNEEKTVTNSEKRKQPTRQQRKNEQQQTPPKKKQPRKQPKIGVIGANPSQSKHLETATMNVHGMDVDFVNLRAEEVYELDSRIPTSKTRMFGTPLEDALRRDFTINSLFYNIRTHKIEDWTGRGLDDLFLHRRVVTPVDPHTTFHDDPLRVLRAIRFAVRLNFTLDDAIKEAAMSHRVHHSLHAKVSRERVGKEVEGMLSGKHARPGCALQMIAELHLAGSVFAFPGSFPGDHAYYVGGGKVSGHILDVEYNCSLGAVAEAAAASSGEKVCIEEAITVAAKHRARGWEESSCLLNVLPPLIEGHVDEKEKINAKKSADMKPPSTVLDQRLLHLCVFILPFHNLTYPDKKGRLVPVTTHMVKEALKFPNQDIQAVSKILSHVDEMANILSEIRSQMAAAQEEGRSDDPAPTAQPCRLRIGLLLRSLKEHWVTCLITASAWEMRTRQRLHANDSKGDVSIDSRSMEEPSRELYRVIIEDLTLDECWKAQPHLNGQEIIKELSLPSGPLVGVFLDDQIRWTLLNPGGTREQCLAHLQQCKREREVDYIDQSLRSDTVAGGGVGIATMPSSLVLEKDSGAKPSKKVREK